jgi:hypothetical protein
MKFPAPVLSLRQREPFQNQTPPELISCPKCGSRIWDTLLARRIHEKKCWFMSSK